MKKNITVRTFLIFTVLAGFLVNAAGADTLKIHLTYKHKLNEAGQTKGTITINQKLYTPDDELFRELNYNETTSQIDTYIFYFYKEGKLYTSECYDQKDSLLYILRHQYDENGREVLTTRLTPENGKLIISGKTVRKFDNNGRETAETIYFGKKPGITTKNVYDGAGMLISSGTTCKPVSGDSLKLEKRTYSYTPEKRILLVKVYRKNVAGKVTEYNEQYAYNGNGQLTSVKFIKPDNSILFEHKYSYLQSGAPSIFQEVNPKGIVTLLLQYDYKKHYMERGIQLSRYESL
jgi:hypothetical protein